MRRFSKAFLLGTVLTGLAFVPAAVADEAAESSETPAVSLSLTYTADFWNVVDGGIDSDAVYLDDLDMQLALDLERLVGWKGAQAFIYALYVNGNSIGEFVGDMNGISNIETGVEALRLTEAWIDQSFAEGRGSARIGLYDVASEFDAGEVRALFLNAAHGTGTDFAQGGVNGPSAWPVTSLALRLNWQFDNDIYLRGAVADGVPGHPDFPKRTTIDLRSDDGLLLTAETGIARDGRLWSFGGWTYTEDAADLSTADMHQNWGAYLAIEEALLSADSAGFGLSGSARIGIANDDVNPVATQFSATLVATGLIPAWPEDQIGLGFILSDGSDKYIAGLPDPKDHEINIELTYFANLTESVTIQPDIQYVINPGMDGSVDNAFVFGVRIAANRNFSLD